MTKPHDREAHLATELPYAVHRAQGMIRESEKKLLFHTVRDMVRSGTHIIDAGCFLGSSTVTIGAALAQRDDKDSFLRQVHSYDLFKVGSEFYSRFVHHTIPEGGSFLPLFLDNTRAYADYFNVYPGDFREQSWIGRPIGLVFCDISKAIQIEAHLWRTFASSFIPGETLFIQQDFVHIGAPFVQQILACFVDHFEFLAVEPPSLLMRCVAPISKDHVKEAIAFYLNADLADRLEKIDVLIERTQDLKNEETNATLELLKAVICHKKDDFVQGQAIAERVAKKYGDFPDNYFQARLRKVVASFG